MLNLYKRLFQKLNEEISYAAWKDCHNLNDFLNGNGDVDLLVNEDQKAKFEKILYVFSFIKVESRILNFPSVRHYYGYDNDSGKICHLNIYYKMNTGASHLKGYRLPFEKVALENRSLNSHGIYVADFWVQSIIYTLRHYLKRSSILGFLLWIREKESYLKEYKYIEEGLIKEEENHRRDEFIKNCSLPSNVLDFKKVNLKVGTKQYFLSLERAKKLFSYKRIGGFEAKFRSATNFLSLLLIRLKGEKKIIKQGKIIAISGVDGAGKSSMVKELKNWLDDFFNVSIVHVGTPPATFLTLPLKFFIWFRGKIVGRGVNDNVPANPEAKKPGLIYSIRYLALAYERYRLCKKIDQKAQNGSIIITDRYVGKNLGKMDSPRIGAEWPGLTGLLGKLESSYYQKTSKADLLLFLDVSVEEAKRRNRLRKKDNKETDEEIEMRHKVNKNLTFKVFNYNSIDANYSYKKVLKSIKAVVWDQLSSPNGT